MAAEKDIEKKVRNIVDSKPAEGEGLQEFQKAQNELLGINSQRAANLQTERAVGGAEAQNNENLAQAAQLAAAASVGGAAGAQIQSMNPRTQDILGKYGIGKPGTKTTRNQTRQVTPQNVVINNNTQTTTTNNVVPANIGGPVQGRAVQISPNSPDQGMAKFKTWLTGIFAKQKEASAQRERAYEKKEWSLSRSGNKIMRKLESLGKTFSEKLNPKRIGNIFGDQLKTLLFLLGFQYLSTHWEGFLKTVKKIEEKVTDFLGYLGFGEKGKAVRDAGGFFNNLGNGIVKFFGGKPGQDTVASVLGNLFEDLVNLIGDKFSLMMQSRADAMKQVKFPDLDIRDIGGTLKGLATYLGDILTCMMSGTKGAAQSIGHELENSGSQWYESDEEAKNVYLGRKYNEELNPFADFVGDNRPKDTSVGDSMLHLRGAENAYLDKTHVNSDNELTGLGAASIQGQVLSRYVQAPEQINTAKTLVGFHRMENFQKKEGSVPLTADFYHSLGLTDADIKRMMDEGKIVQKMYKYVSREKTVDELDRETDGDPAVRKDKNIPDSALVSGIKKADNVAGTIRTISDPMQAVTEASLKAGYKITEYATRGLRADKNKLEMVPEDDPRPAVILNRGKLGNLEKFPMLNLTESGLDEIKSKLGVSNFDYSDRETVVNLEKFLIDRKKALHKDRKFKNDSGDRVSVDEYYKTTAAKDFDTSKFNVIDDLEKQDKKRWEDHEKNWDKNYPTLAATRNSTKQAWDDALEWGKGILGMNEVDVNTLDYKNVKVTNNAKDFTAEMLPIFRKVLVEKGIDPGYAEYMVGQAGLESNWGGSKLMRSINNIGGIEVSKENKDSVKHIKAFDKRANNGAGENRYYRVYDSLEDYVRHKISFLTKMDRYKNPFNNPTEEGEDYDKYIKKVSEGGYAEAKNGSYQHYADAISSTIKMVKKISEELAPQTDAVPQEEIPQSGPEFMSPPEINKASLAEGVFNGGSSSEDSGNVPEFLRKPEQKPSYLAVNGITGKPLKMTPDSVTPASGNLIASEKSTKKSATEAAKSVTAKVNTDILGTVRDVASDIKEQKYAISTLADRLEELALYAASTGNSVTVNNTPAQKEKVPSVTPIKTPWGNNINT